jgi:hypothetical protein
LPSGSTAGCVFKFGVGWESGRMVGPGADVAGAAGAAGAAGGWEVGLIPSDGLYPTEQASVAPIKTIKAINGVNFFIENLPMIG